MILQSIHCKAIRISPILCFLCLILILSSCSKNATENITDTPDPQKPNILIVIADDLGYEVPQVNGGTSYQTPNINRLAAMGKRYTQCHSSPICSPSRFALFTGKYNFRNYTLWGRLNTNERTFANMLQNAGYTTCYTGKWQLDGGDASVKTFGWQNYLVWLPFYVDKEEDAGSRYKGAKLYQAGNYLPDSQTDTTYPDDAFTNFITEFIDDAHARSKPFLAVYSMILPHAPFTPTPDDAAYATWNFKNGKSDTKYYGNMVKYADKKLGEIMDHLSGKDLLKNTLVIFMADNGTSRNITSQFTGFAVQGGKSETTEPGTNVPLIAAWQDHIPAGSISTTVIDFTDFLPTFADMANISKPADYGMLDGISFYETFFTVSDIQVRESIYDAYSLNRYETAPGYNRWAQDRSYKLYDAGNYAQSGRFIKLEKGRPDGLPLSENDLTEEEQKIKETLKTTLEKYH